MKKMILGLAALVAVAAFAAPAQAATTAELQAQIDALLAQLSALQGSSSSSSSSCYTFTRDLTVGATGADVTALQNFLASKGVFSVAATGYFGPITQSAVASWQSSNGVSPAAGYFGAISRAKYSSMCSPSTSGGNTSGGDSDSDFFGGSDEGYLDDFDQLSKYTTEEVGENEEDVPVLGVEFEAKDADQMIERVVVEIDSTTPSGSDDLEDYITDVSLWLDGEEIGRMDVDEAGYTRSTDFYSFRFTGLEGVVEEGNMGELVVAVSAVGNIDGTDAGENIAIEIPDDGIRASSPNGVVDEYSSFNPDVETTFSVETFADATGVELKLTESSDNPDAQTVQVDDTNETDNVELLRFTMEAKSSDVTVFEMPVLFTIGSSTIDVSDVANRATLSIDGDDFSETIAAEGADGNATVTFEDLDFTISEGDEVEVVLTVDLNEQSGNYDAGETIKADIGTTQRDAIDAEDESGENLDNSDKKGAITGENQTLRISGAVIEAGSSVAPKAIPNDDASTTDNQVEFKVVFEVQAFDTELFIAKTAERDTTESDFGVNYTIEDASAGGTATTTGTVSASLTSTADTESGYFRVDEGQTETFTLTVVYDPALTSFYQLQLYSLNFNASSAAAPDVQQLVTPAEDFETDSINVIN